MTSAEARIEGHGRDVAYYEAHYRELLAQYPGQWIAIMDQEVVGAADDAFELVAKLKAGGIPANEVLRRHMTNDPELLMLASRGRQVHDQAMTESFTLWDVTEQLRTREDMLLYLEACADEDPGDGSLIRAALGDIEISAARSQGRGRVSNPPLQSESAEQSELTWISV